MHKKSVIFQAFTWVILLSMLLASVSPAYAANSNQTGDPAESDPTAFTISGIVVDAQQNPLGGVTISTEQGNSVVTAPDGTYVLADLPAGTYMVTPALMDVLLLPIYRVVRIVNAHVGGVDFYVSNEVRPSRQPVGRPVPANMEPAPLTVKANGPWSAPEVQEPLPEGGDLQAQSAFTLGLPGMVYRFEASKGTTEVSYITDANHLNNPSGLFVDSDDNLLVVEKAGRRLLGYDAGGTQIFSLGLAGVGYYAGDVFVNPQDVTRDDGGNYWLVESNRLVELDSARDFLRQVPEGNPGLAGVANDRFSDPEGVAFGDDLLFVSDGGNHRIQVYTFTAGMPVYFRTIGEVGVAGPDVGQFDHPTKIVFYNHALYVMDSGNDRIMRCVMTVAGSSCSQVALNGAAITAAAVDSPSAVAFSASKMYVADAGNYRVLACDQDGTDCAHFAGVAGELGSAADHFAWLSDLAVSSDGKIHVSDADNHRVQIFDDTGTLLATYGSTYASGEPQPYTTDYNYFNDPSGLVIGVESSISYLYVAENAGRRLLKYNLSTGAVVWSRGTPGVYGKDDAHFGTWDGGPEGNLAKDSKGRIYVSDTTNHRVLIYLANGDLWGVMGEVGVSGTDNDHFNMPAGIALAANDDIYIADSGNHRIQIYDKNRNFKATLGETGLAGNDSTHFNWPMGVALDDSSNIYVADTLNQRVQKCDLSRNCTPFAGKTGVSAAGFDYLTAPKAVIVAVNQVFVVDSGRNRVLVFNKDGAFRTVIAGGWGTRSGDLRDAAGIAVEANGTVYVSDPVNQRIQKYAYGLTGWNQLALDGYGYQYKPQVQALEAYGGNLYAGVLNSQSRMAELHRMDSNGNWSLVVSDGFGSPGNIAIDDLIEFNGSLYASTWNESAGGQLWSSADGTTWTQVELPGGFDTWNAEISQMAVFNSLLYVGTMVYGDGTPPHGAQIWSYDPVTPAWTLVFDAPDTQKMAVKSFAVMGSYLYAGLADENNGGQVYRCSTTACSTALDWQHVFVDGNGSANAVAVDALEVFNEGADKLYAGLSNPTDGAMVFEGVCDDLGCTWTQVNTSGFGSTANTHMSALQVFDNHLLALTRNEITGMQIWGFSSAAWSAYLLHNGFGNSTQLGPYSDAAVGLFASRLIVGTIDLEDGAGLWATAPATYTISGGITGLSSNVNVQLFKSGVLLQTKPAEVSLGGVYAFDPVPDGVYVVKPTSPSYSFTPRLLNVTVSGGDVDLPLIAADYSFLPLATPLDGTRLTGSSVTLEWVAIGASLYQVQVSTSETFATIYKTTQTSRYTFPLPALPWNKTFYWRVRSISPTPVGDWSTIWSFTTPNPPSVPVLLLPAAGAKFFELQPTFTWKPSTGNVAKYQIQISQSLQFTSLDLDEYTQGTEITYTPPAPLTSNRMLYWRVRAVAANGDASAWTTPRKFYTLPGVVPTLSPASGETVESLLPTLQWGDPEGVGAFQVQITTFGSSFLIADVTKLYYTLTTSLVPYSQYWWRIRAKGLGGYGPWSDAVMFYAPNPPGAASLLTPLSNAVVPDWQPSFTWNSVVGATQYRLQISANSLFPFGDLRLDRMVTGTSYNMTSDPADILDANKAFYWRVAACNSLAQCGKFSTGRKFSTKPGMPALLTPADAEIVNKRGVTFTWDDQPEPGAPINSTAFTIQIMKNADCTSLVKTADVTGLTYTTTLSVGTFYWHVKAKGVGGTAGGSDWSVCRQIVVNAPPAAPALSAPAAYATVPDYRNIAFSWTEPAGAVGYELHISRSSTYSYLDLSKDDIATNSWTEDATTYLWGGGIYYWRVRAKDVNNLWGPWSSSRRFTTLSTVWGFVYDVSDPDGVTGVAGVDVSVTIGTTTVSAVTGDGSMGDLGYFIIHNVPTGSGTVKAVKTGYLERSYPIKVLAASQNRQDFGFVPTPAANTYALVATWPYTPYRNLDIHFWTPDGAYRSHVFPSNPGKIAENPYAHLDAYNNAYVTEVLTVDRVNAKTGKYVLGVSQSYPTSGTIRSSGAKVEVYDETGVRIAGPYNVPTLVGAGMWWNVFEFTKAEGVNLDISTTGTPPTLVNKVQSASPAPYTGDEGIYGVVRLNGSIRGFAGIEVSIDGPVKTVIKTDASGYFSVGGLPGGTYNVTPSIAGYIIQDPTTRVVEIKSGDAVVWNWTGGIFYMLPSSDIGGDHHAIATQGHFVYMASGPSLDIINIADKDNPVLVKRFLPSIGVINDIALKGNFAYLASGDGLNIIDITNPASPTLAGYYLVYGGPTGVAVQGRYAYLTYGWGDLFILDVSNPASPTYVSEFHLAGYADKVMVSGNYAYLTYNNTGAFRGVVVVNVASPSSPMAVGYAEVKEYPIDLAIADGYIYLVGGQAFDYITGAYTGGKMYVYELSNPLWPDLINTIDRTDPVYGIAAGDGNVFAANAAGGLLVYDAEGATLLGSLATEGDAWSAAYFGDFLYLGNTAKMQVVDVADRENPVGRGIYTPAP